MTLFNKVGREFNGWLDKKLDGWIGTIPLMSIMVLLMLMLGCGVILAVTWSSL